jgi:amino acid transporter
MALLTNTSRTMVGGLSFFVSLAMAEIAAAFPTAGGIYYWSYRLGGDKFGALLSWLTGKLSAFRLMDYTHEI